jgi:cobyrinic acid a,c-diamide synthase
MASMNISRNKTEKINIDETRKSLLNTAPRLAIVGASQGAGVSSFVLGLLTELNQRGVPVATAKLNSSLIETTHYRRITRCLSHTLDPWLLNKSQMLSSLSRLSKGAKLTLLIGEGGLFDKRPAAFSGLSDADILKASQTPAILVIDASAMTENVAVFVLGCCNYNPGVRIIGVVANKVKDAEQDERIRTAINSVTSIKYLGGIPFEHNAMPVFNNVNPSLITKAQLQSYQIRARDFVNIDGILELARTASPLPFDPMATEQQEICCRIGIADDAAFHLVIQDNLNILRQNGAELKSFSPLTDATIPENCNALYFPSGQIKLYLKELFNNKSMLNAIKSFAEQGGIIYAEGDACVYFCKELDLIDASEKQYGLGIIPAVATAFMDKFDNDYFSLCSIRGTHNNFLIHNGGLLRGVRDGRWSLKLESSVPCCFELFDQAEVAACKENKRDIIAHNGGFCIGPNIMLSIAQVHWGTNPAVAKNFIEKAKEIVPPQIGN